jgi:hypothetical protein
MAKVGFSVRPAVIVYHAWEPYQFKGWKAAEPVAARSPLHMAGDYGQIHYRGIYNGPVITRARSVDFARAGSV